MQYFEYYDSIIEAKWSFSLLKIALLTNVHIFQKLDLIEFWLGFKTKIHNQQIHNAAWIWSNFLIMQSEQVGISTYGLLSVMSHSMK